MDIILFVGVFPDKLLEKAVQMLRFLTECVIAVNATKISDGSMHWFTYGLEKMKCNVVQNPSQVCCS